jgi:hypothetical protein
MIELYLEGFSSAPWDPVVQSSPPKPASRLCGTGTHKKWIGTEVVASRNQTSLFEAGIDRRLCRLKTPIVKPPALLVCLVHGLAIWGGREVHGKVGC